ncbi:LuxR C-terminal-related transcriptional regulator [Thalassococcus sp. BH17M4-6]|uniref:LuxR C-terminal-related transcriptional regulator n=1 Tax=Thalassococcus sp. BH17M4-6 TaxID=3413148 RepID=UPI003BC00182
MIGNILILEDVRQSREWLAEIVQKIFPEAFLAKHATLREAEHACSDQRFDLALVDLNLPDGEGTTLLRRLARDQPDCMSVVTTVMATDSAIVSALAAGAQGYLLKSDPEDVLEHQLRLLLSGVPPLSPQIARRIMRHFQMTGPSYEAKSKLTKRETDVLRLIARGLRVAEVAEVYGLADSTVITHIKSIYRKLEVSNRAEAAIHASRLGLLADDTAND